MHLAFLSTHYYPRMIGGAEYNLQHQAETLARRGARVSVLSLHDGEKIERFRHNGVECHAFPAPYFRQCLTPNRRAPALARTAWHLLDVYNPASASLLLRELRQLKPDLLQTENLPGWSCSAWAVANRLSLPHIQVLHDFQLTCPAATRFRGGENCASTCLSCRPFTTVARRLSQSVRHVVANSEYTRELHRRLGFFTQAHSFDVIYGAVKAPAAPTSGPREGDRIRIGYLGRLHPTKGIRTLLDAFIAAGRSDLTLRIAGTGTAAYEAELRAAATGHSVEFLGHVPAAAFLDTVDALVVPSLWHEPMGRVVVEAAAHGVPVIAAARGGIPELFAEGQTGWAFDPAETAQLTKRLQLIQARDLTQMREACRQAAEPFAPEAIAAQWLRLYARVLGHDAREITPAPRTSAAALAPVL